MQDYREVHSGNLSTRARGLWNKSWHLKWCVLYSCNNNEPSKLHVYDSLEQARKDPQAGKVIVLEGVQEITQSHRGKESVFEIVCKKEKHSFLAGSTDECYTWFVELNRHVTDLTGSSHQGISPKQRTISGDLDVDDEESTENLMYESLEKPQEFAVTIEETEASREHQISGRYLLLVSQTNIALAEFTSQKIILSIQLRHIRRYSHKNSVFHFECGRSSGYPGTFRLISEKDKEIYFVVNTNSKMNRPCSRTALASQLSSDVNAQRQTSTEVCESRARAHSASSTSKSVVQPGVRSSTFRHELETKILKHDELRKSGNAEETRKFEDVKKKSFHETRHHTEEKGSVNKSSLKEDKKSEKKKKKELEKEEKQMKKDKKKEHKKDKKTEIVTDNSNEDFQEHVYDDVKEPIESLPQHTYSEPTITQTKNKQPARPVHTYSEPDFRPHPTNSEVALYSEPNVFTKSLTKKPEPGMVYSDVKNKQEAWRNYGKDDGAILHEENFENLRAASAEKAQSTPIVVDDVGSDYVAVSDEENPYDHLQRGIVRLGKLNNDDSDNLYGIASARPIGVKPSTAGQVDHDSKHLSGEEDYYRFEDVNDPQNQPAPYDNDMSKQLTSKSKPTPSLAYEECTPLEREETEDTSQIYDEIK
ncbi:hypothetical protein ScPMuIL_000648 [Solemya velum]